MNDIVKNCVEGRKTAIFNAYDVKNQNTLNKIDELFKKIESFASNYDDAMAFENAFASSELSKEYTELFTTIATSETPKTFASTQTENATGKPEKEDTIVDEIADDAARMVRRQARQEAYNKVRDIPVIGDALNVKQHLDLFGRFRKNKDK